MSENAQGRLWASTGHGEAHAALVLATMRSGAGMPETLAWLQRIRNEQDPVRMAVLAALARVPGHQLQDPDALEAVLHPIFEARDTSFGTRQHAARIAHGLLVSRATEPKSPMFALGLSLLERLAGQRGTPDLPRLDRNLPRGAEHAIVKALQPWIEAARSRQQSQHVFRLWTALGKRAWNVPALATLVEDMIWRGQKSFAGHAAGLWIQAPATRDERVLELVERDRSALYLHPVFEHCHRRQALAKDRHSTTAVLLGALATRLLERPDWWSQGARLQIAATPNERLAATLLELFGRAPTPRCAGALVHAARAAAELPARDGSAAAAEDAAATLGAGPPAARLAAVAWVAAHGPRWGWSAHWVDVLAWLREDSDLDVRTSAREVWLARA